jgi:hypothetical protein
MFLNGAEDCTIEDCLIDQVGGNAVKLSQSAESLELSLTADMNWDPTDTVIVLKIVETAAQDGAILKNKEIKY